MVVFVSFFAFILLILFYIIIPTINEIKKINQYIYQERKDSEIKFQISKKNKEIRQNYFKIKPYFSRLNDIYLIEDKKIDFFVFMEKKAQERNLKINTNLFPLESANALAFKIELEGIYFDFLKFLIDLEGTDYYININEISINDALINVQTGDFFVPTYLKKEKFGSVKVILSGEIYQKEKNFLDNNLF